MLYFNHHYDQLFVERKLYLKHFQCIEIEFDGIRSPTLGSSVAIIHDYRSVHKDRYNDREMIFLQNSNQTYPIDKKTIEIKNIKKGIESFGIVYKNVFKWFKSRQEASSNTKAAINGCKIALFTL